MREIKYRVRNSEHKIIGYERQLGDGWQYSHNNFQWKDGVINQPGDREQFLGRKDLDGREVYEHDITIYWYNEGANGRKAPRVVEWIGPSESHKWVGFNVQGSKNIKVIGDMYSSGLIDNNESTAPGE